MTRSLTIKSLFFSSLYLWTPFVFFFFQRSTGGSTTFVYGQTQPLDPNTRSKMIPLSTTMNNNETISNQSPFNQQPQHQHHFMHKLPQSPNYDKLLLMSIRDHIIQDHEQLNQQLHYRVQCVNEVKAPYSQSLLKRHYLNVTSAIGHQSTIFMCDFPLTESSLGNRLSEYFEGLACADLNGMHFMNTLPIGEALYNQTFLHSLPMVVSHENPSFHIKLPQLYENVLKHCPLLTTYPHENKGAWCQRIELISTVLSTALYDSISNPFNQTIPKTTFENVTFGIEYQHNDKVMYPLIPDAVILFRCKDILLVPVNSFAYGFLPFETYTKLISRNVSSIYVLSESLSYRTSQYGDRYSIDTCTRLSNDLLYYLSKQFPQAMIGLRRGYPFDSFSMLSLANTVVCTPSTFCFWPGFVRRKSNPSSYKQQQQQQFQQQRKLYLSSNSLFRYQPKISSNFYWLLKPQPIRFYLKDDVVKNRRYPYSELLQRLMIPLGDNDVMFANSVDS